MTQSNETTLIMDRFAELKRQEKAIKAELESLKTKALDIVIGQEGQYNGGSFLVKFGRRDKWVFTPAIDGLADALKTAKEDEKASGLATKEPGTPFVTFKDLSQEDA